LQYLPDLPSDDYEPLSMVRLVSGTEAIGWENLYDVRQFFSVSSTGTGGGDTTLTANRVVVTNDAGQQTTNQYFQYDYDNNVLVLGAGISDVPTLGTNSFHFMGSGTSPSWNLWAFGTSIAGFNTFFRARGDWTTPLALQHGDVIGRPARFRGHDGSTFPATRGEIRGQARGAWDTSSHGTEIIISITPSGTTTMQDMLTVNQVGNDLLYGTYNISGSPHTHDINDLINVREILVYNRTYYVRTDGNDSNTGLVDSAGGAFLTLQHAYDVATGLDMAGYTVTIQIKDGTYTGGLVIDKPWVGGSLIIQGNSGTPANVLVSTSGNCVQCNIAIPGSFTLKDMKLTSSASSCIEHFGVGVFSFTNIDFGSAASGYHISSNTAGGNVRATGNYAITGGAALHWACIGGGTIECKNITITITGTPAFSYKFAIATQGLGNIRCEGNTFSGSATGTRYLAEANGVIYTNGGGANYLPGDSAGSTATGGQYT